MEKKKTKFWRRGLALVLAVSLIAGTFLMLPTKAVDTGTVGKLVDSFEKNTSRFTLTEKSRFFFTSEPTGDLLQTVQLVQRQFAADSKPSSQTLDIVWSDVDKDENGIPDMIKAGDIWVKLVDNTSGINLGLTSDEGYLLEVNEYAIVTAYGVDGLLYGLNMLHKHLRASVSNDKVQTIEGFTCRDNPDTKERVVSLDCARKYLTKNYICNFVREMSWMGYNTLQLHFSEDSGFRFDLWDETIIGANGIDYNGDGTFYKPANDFSWLCGAHPTSWTHTSELTGVNYAAYSDDMYNTLSMSEIIEILETCKEYHIDVIPSFDTPAHLDYTTWKFEQNYKSNNNYSFYSTYDKKTYYAKDLEVPGCINYSNVTGKNIPQFPYYTSVNIKSDQAKAFIFELYIDMANFFKEFSGSSDFSIGADEVRMSDNTTWVYDDFVNYINELNTLLNNKGYTVRMYNDFMANTSHPTELEYADNIEILYWVSPFAPNTGEYSPWSDYYQKYTETYEPAKYFVDQERTLYNCIQTNTYYVLRINDDYGDARSKTNYNWTFYHSDEENIYNEWYPAGMREYGKFSETKENAPDVPEANLGGGYFLIWHDYAMVNTETEIWNGVQDFAGNPNGNIKSKYQGGTGTGEFYSLRYRMWSNIIKMWNADINTTDGVTYSTFASIRNLLGDFPGLDTDPSTGTYSDANHAKAVTLPDATAPIQLGDHDALTEALANKIAKGYYTDESYNAYLAAYDAAEAVNNNNSASDAQLTEALNNLNTAKDGLTIKSYTLDIYLKTKIDNVDYTIDHSPLAIPANSTDYEIYFPALEGYLFLRAENGNFVPSKSGDGSGYLVGTATTNTTITLWYENAVDTSRLDTLIAKAATSQTVSGDIRYTDSSWAAYQSALGAAKDFTPGLDTRQSAVDALVNDLEDAQTALVTNHSGESYMEIEFLNENFYTEEAAGLHIKTSPDIKSITVKNVSENNRIETLTYCSGEVQTLKDGSVVKYWVVFFELPNFGDYDVIGCDEGNTEKVSKTI